MRTEFDRVWRIKTRLPERKGERCRLLVRGGKLDSALIQFERDGAKVVTGQHAFRKIKP